MDQYHYISADNKHGTSGISTTGSVCIQERKYRTAISEFVGTKNWEGWEDNKMGCALVSIQMIT